jgi:hypothetical protein
MDTGMTELPAIGDTVRIERGAHAGHVGTCVYSSVCSPKARHGENVVVVSFSVDGRPVVARVHGEAVTAVQEEANG